MGKDVMFEKQVKEIQNNFGLLARDIALVKPKRKLVVLPLFLKLTILAFDIVVDNEARQIARLPLDNEARAENRINRTRRFWESGELDERRVQVVGYFAQSIKGSKRKD